MNKKALLSAFVIAAAALIYSCEMDSDTNTVVVSSYATYVSTSSPTGFVSDDSLKIIPTNDISTSSLSHGAKVVLTWSYDSKKGITDPMYAQVNSYSGVMQGKSFLSERPDTLGTVGADLYRQSSAPVWRSGGVYDAPVMINIVFEYLTNNNGAYHSINLSYSSESCDSDGFFHMKFSHSSTDLVTPTLATNDFCAFTLPEVAYAADTKGVILAFDGMDGTPVNYKFTFATGKLEKLESEE